VKHCSQQDEHCLAEERGGGIYEGELGCKESATPKILSLLWMGNS